MFAVSICGERLESLKVARYLLTIHKCHTLLFILYALLLSYRLSEGGQLRG